MFTNKQSLINTTFAVFVFVAKQTESVEALKHVTIRSIYQLSKMTFHVAPETWIFVEGDCFIYHGDSSSSFTRISFKLYFFHPHQGQVNPSDDRVCYICSFTSLEKDGVVLPINTSPLIFSCQKSMNKKNPSILVHLIPETFPPRCESVLFPRALSGGY